MKKETIKGKQVVLENGNEVWVGELEGDFVICFKNAERKTELSFRISPEAAHAMASLILSFRAII